MPHALPRTSVRRVSLLLLLLVAGTLGCGQAEAPAAAEQQPSTQVKAVAKPAEPPLWELAVERLLAAGDREGASTVCDRVLAQEPKNAQALVWRALSHLQAAKTEQCHADLDAALAIDPNCADAWAAKGDVELAAHVNHEAARELYGRALELDPRCELALRARARSFAVQELHDEAIADYTKLIGMAESHADYFERCLAYVNLANYEAALQDVDAAIRLRPDDAMYFAERSIVHDTLKQFDAAMADATKAIELDPENAYHYWTRASLRIHAGDVDAGIKDWLAAIDLTPDHAGKHYEFRRPRNEHLSDDDLRHGEEQLKAILRDRPEMSEYVKPGDRLWTWAVRKLAGEDVGEPVYWDPRPLRHAPAAHQRPSKANVGVIQIANDPIIRGDGDGTAFEQCWAGLTFELHNMTFADEFDRASDAGESTELDKHNYVRSMSQIEDRAGQLHAAFYAHVFLPWAKEAGFTKSDPGTWMDRFPDIESAPPTDEFDAQYYSYYADGYEVYMSQEECKAGKHGEAKARLDTILSRPTMLEDDALASAHHWLGYAQLALGDETKALESFRQAVAYSDEWLGEFIYPVQGRKFISKAVESETTRDAGAHFLRGYAWGSLGDSDKELADLDKALEIDPQFVAARFHRATVYRYQEDIERCLADLNKVLEINPGYHYARTTRGGVFMEQRQFAKALADFNEDVRRRPDSAEALLFRAQAYTFNYDEDKALADLDAAIRLNERYDAAYSLRGSVKCDRGDIAGGMADFEQALKLNPEASDVYYARALKRIRLRDYAQALADLEHCLGELVEDAWVLAFKGEALVGQGDLDAAVAAAEAAIKLDSTLFLGHSVLGDVHKARGEFAEALADYDCAVEAMPDVPDPYLSRAKLFSECDDPQFRNLERAIADATRACEITESKDVDCLAALAACHAEAGDFAKAIEWQTKALETAQGDWKAQQEQALNALRANKTLRQAASEPQTTAPATQP